MFTQISESNLSQADQIEPGQLVRRWLLAFSLHLILWFLLIGSFEWQIMLIGVLIANLLTLLLWSHLSWLDDVILTPLLPWYIIQLTGVIFWALLIANLDIAQRVFSKKVPFYPGSAEVNVHLQSPFAQLLLAVAIDLTPGVFSIAINQNQQMQVDWLDVRPAHEDLATATRLLTERFEYHLKKILR